MKNLILVSVLFLSGLAQADGNLPPSSSKRVSVTHIQAATTCVESNVAAGAAIALTVPASPDATQPFFYITSVNIQLIAIAAPLATLQAVTSTNVPGSKSWRFGVQATVGTWAQIESFGVGGLKTTAASTATTFAMPLLANLSANMSVCGFYGT